MPLALDPAYGRGDALVFPTWFKKLATAARSLTNEKLLGVCLLANRTEGFHGDTQFAKSTTSKVQRLQTLKVATHLNGTKLLKYLPRNNPPYRTFNDRYYSTLALTAPDSSRAFTEYQSLSITPAVLRWPGHYCVIENLKQVKGATYYEQCGSSSCKIVLGCL